MKLIGILIFVAAAFAIWVVAYMEGFSYSDGRWRTWMCERDGAVLVADTLCMQAGSYDPAVAIPRATTGPINITYRVPEPRRSK